MPDRTLGIDRISLANFKGIGSTPVSIPLKPITLLFGANSAGKSTILQALQYAREILERQHADPDRTLLGGEAVDLGGFQGLVHRRESERTITIGIEARISDDPLEGADPLLDHWTASAHGPDGLNVSGLIDIESVGIRLSTAWDHLGNRAWIHSYTARINDEDVASIACDGPGEPPEIDDVNWEHPLFLALMDRPSHLGDEPTEDDPTNIRGLRVPTTSWIEAGNEPDDYLGGLRNDLRVHLEHHIQRGGRSSLVGMTTVIPDFDRPLPHQPDVQVSDDLLQGTDATDDRALEDAEDRTVTAIFRSIFGQCLIGVGQRILSELQGIRYLGPIRSVPERDHHRPRHAQADRWATGLAAWDLIQAHYDPKQGCGDDLVQRISETLADPDRLALGYRLDVIGSRRLDDDSLTMLGLQQVLRDYDDLDAETFRELVWKPLQDLPIEPRIVLRDQRQGVDLAAQDIGVGVSQVVPVVVAAMAGRASLVAIEQPELHIHPAVQVALGDVFIREASGNDRRFLLETHSEHIVLRLLRRIREAAETTDPDPDLRLSPDDLAVIWVEQDAEGLSLTELPVDETGEFLRPWPRGFFDERAEELF